MLPQLPTTARPSDNKNLPDRTFKPFEVRLVLDGPLQTGSSYIDSRDRSRTWHGRALLKLSSPCAVLLCQDKSFASVIRGLTQLVRHRMFVRERPSQSIC